MKGIFGPYRDKSIEDFEILDSSHSQAVEITQQYMANLKDHRQHGKGLFLMGPSGVGKTFLANMVLKYAQEEGFKVEALELDTYIDLHHRLFKFNSEDEEFYPLYERLQSIKNRTDFVLFDDIGREHESGSGWSNEMLFNIFRYRWNRLRPTIFTTNLSPQELGRRYSEGFTSLLHEATHIVMLEGDDYRCVGGR